MAIYSKTLSPEWREAFDHYERVSGFEPMHQDEIDSGDMTVEEAWQANIQWFESVHSEVMNISTPDS